MPIESYRNSLPVIVQQILDIIKQASNAESEPVQVALKSLATVFQDGPPVQVKEKDLVYLIEFLSPDLEEPTRQASIVIISSVSRFLYKFGMYSSLSRKFSLV